MIGWSLQCYIPSFMEIRQAVPEKKIFGRFYHIGAWRHPGQVTSIMSSDFYFLVPESSHTKFGSDRHSSFLENPVQILYVHDIGPRSKNDLDLQYSHIFIYSIRCLPLPTFRSLAATVSEKIHCFQFFLVDFCRNYIYKSRSLQGHHLNKL